MAQTQSVEDLTEQELFDLMKLKNGDEAVLRGETWLRLEDEFKISPHGEDGDYDTDASWVDRAEILSGLKSSFEKK